jgi:hypothetical protein
MASPVYAIGNPSYVSIGDVAVFEDVFETGDMLFFMRYDVSYSPVPEEEPEDTWMVALYSSDEATLLGSRALNYYQHNIISIYFDADQVTSKGLATGAAYKFKVMGSPSVFGELVEDTNVQTSTLAAGDYRDLDELGGYMIAQAKILEDDWGIALLTGGERLNATGATYFNAAVPGLYNVVPEIYQTTTITPSPPNTTWTVNRTWESHKPFSLNAAVHDLSDWWGTDPNWMGSFMIVLIGGVLGSVVFAATRQPDLSFIFALMAFPLGAWIGLISLPTFVMIIMTIGMIAVVLYFQAKFS